MIKDNDDELMVITMEECGELIQVCAKAMRTKEYSSEKLTEEVGDVMCMVGLLMQYGLIDEEDIEEVKNKLIDTIQKIMVDQNFTPTANSRVCSYCDHAKSGACPTGVYRNKNNSYRK